MGEGEAGISEDIMFELHLKQWVGVGQVSKEKLEGVFQASGRPEAKAWKHEI